MMSKVQTHHVSSFKDTPTKTNLRKANLRVVTDTPWNNKGPANLSGKKDVIRMSQERNQTKVGARDVTQSQEGQLSIVT